MDLAGGRYLEHCRPGWAKQVASLRGASYSRAKRFYKALALLSDEGLPLHREEVAYLACNDRFYLLTVLLRRPDADKEWLYDRCREVEADPDEHLDLWAREHYKSTIITFAGIIQEIVRDPEITIAIYSVVKKIARDFLAQIKEELEGNELLPAIFPDVFWENPAQEAPIWSRIDGIVVKRNSNPKEATVEGHGLIDAQPTGKHFRLRVYDDAINQDYITPDMVKKATNRVELSTNTKGGEGRSWYIGTRYHFADTYGILLERGTLLPRIYPATHDGTLKGRPVLLSQPEWDKRVNEQRGTVAAQMLQNPLAGEENSFRGEWLRPYWLRPARMNVYIVGDPSKGKRNSSDNTAIAVIGIDTTNNRYLLDGYCHRMKLTERWSSLRNLWMKWSKAPGVMNCEVGWEQYGLVTDIEYFEQETIRERLDLPEIRELGWVRDSLLQSKADRVERMEPYFRNSKFWLPARVYDKARGSVCTWATREGSQIPTTMPTRMVTPDDPDGYLTKVEREAVARGESWRLMEPIKRMDSDKATYDVVLKLFEEYIFFPFAPHDDFIDVMSRVDDMDPTVPVSYDLRNLAAPVHAD